MYRKVINLGLCLLLSLGCNSPSALATATDTQVAENSFSNLYSNAEFNLKLAANTNAPNCAEDACAEKNMEFDARIQTLGVQLNEIAFWKIPELSKRFSAFEFSVSDKSEVGMLSSATGKVVVFRGVQHLNLSDDALRFILAREMGHVIARHHKKNIFTRLMISAVASLVFPAISLVGASSTATQATTATQVVTGLASTATSVIGNEVASKSMKPSQTVEADELAIQLVPATDLTWQQIVQNVQANTYNLEKIQRSTWCKELIQSIEYLEHRDFSTAGMAP